MKALLLAAGKGTRISRYLGGNPKCTVNIGDEILIHYTVSLLKKKGINNIGIVVGYQDDVIKEVLSDEKAINFFYNPFYEITNSLASAWFARDFIDDDMLIMNADVFLEEALLDDILSCKISPVLFSDETRKEEADFKLFYKDGLLIDYGKELEVERTTGEYIGVVTFNKSFVETFKTNMCKMIKEKKYSKIFVLSDTHTHECCVYTFLQKFPFEVEIIEVEAGEEHKNLDTCLSLWQTLSDLEADRKSLLINVGGGVVTDMGGFVASTFKRGIDFINVPTTLLAMVDASIGGKTGVDLGVLKNQIGVINNPQLLLIDVNYLATLPKEEFRSGLAEMFKHGLIQSPAYWEKMKQLSALTTDDLEEIIYESVVIKHQVVKQDPKEQGLRKILNFGHTLGHAIESYCLAHRSKRLLHGEAVAIGMILAAFLSHKLLHFPWEKTVEIKRVLLDYFSRENFSAQEIAAIQELLKYDKKNAYGHVYFVLLEAIGQPKWNIEVEEALIEQAFAYYSEK